jgi:hypothetical protein
MSYRHQLIGLDKPVTEPLSAVANPLTVLRYQALLHESHRLETVAEAMALVGVMTFKHALSGREKVTVRGAIFQFGRGTGMNLFSKSAVLNRSHFPVNFATFARELILSTGLSTKPTTC